MLKLETNKLNAEFITQNTGHHSGQPMTLSLGQLGHRGISDSSRDILLIGLKVPLVK